MYSYFFAVCVPRLRCVFVWLIVTMVGIYSVFFAWRANLNIEKPLLLGVVSSSLRHSSNNVFYNVRYFTLKNAVLF